MSLTISPTSSSVPSPFAHLWTRADCTRLEAAGILNYRYELVEGIINRMSQNMPHRTGVSRLTGWLYRIFTEDYVQSQSPINVAPEDNPTSRPEPDVAVLTVSLPELTRQNPELDPTSEQVRLIVEVADSTLRYDLITKAGLYARAGIPEYWVLDLNGRKLHIFRRPADGHYRDSSEYTETDIVSCSYAPTQTIVVSALLP